MSLKQYQLFEYTRGNDLLIGQSVIEADKIKRHIKGMQKRGCMVENWRLDIFCRDPHSISDAIIERVNPSSAAAIKGSYAIAIVISPSALTDYTLSVAYFEGKEEATAVLDTVRAYLTHRYGV